MTKTQRWKLVRDRGHTSRTLAEAAGVTFSTVCRTLNGTQFSVESADKIARALKTSVAVMWPKAVTRMAA